MIKETMPLSIAETSEFLQKKDVELVGFINDFTKLDSKKAKGFRKDMEALKLLKVSPKHISKIIDLVPKTKEDLNKIFIDVSLDEDETNKILDEVKKFK